MTTKLTDTDLDGYQFAVKSLAHPVVPKDVLLVLFAEVREYRALLAGVPVDRAVVVDADDLGHAVRALADALTSPERGAAWEALANRLMARLAERDARDGA